jgi:plastocyanin
VLDTGPFVIIQPDASKNQSSNGFSPDRLVVVLGVNSTVTWINDDATDQTVTSTSFSEPFNSGNLSPHQDFVFTFTKPGSFDYVSIYYPWMKGTVVVLGNTTAAG